MIPAPKHPLEASRLEALRFLQILDTPPEKAFDAITASIAAATGAPIALVSIVDEGRQWFKSKVGLDAPETHRDFAFCAHAILSKATLVVNDSEKDERFADNPLVTAAPFVKSYVGAPIFASEDHPLGTLCIIDNAPREWTALEISLIEKHASIVSSLMCQRRVQLDLGHSVERLTKEVQEMHLLVEEIGRQSGVGGWTLDVTTSEVTWSDETRKIHGVDDDFKPVLETALDFYEPEARPVVQSSIDQAISCGDDWDFTLPIINAQDQKIWVRATGRAVDRQKNREKLIGSFQDVTIQRTRELELQAARDAAQKACDAKDAFLANMSHEIRTPLNGLLALMDALTRGKLDDHQLQILDIMRTSGNTLNRILTDILDCAKAESGLIDVVEQEFELEHVVTSSCYTHSASAREKGLHLSTAFDDSVKGYWIGDAIRISQIVSNLVSNAVKFTDEGSISVHVDASPCNESGQNIISIQIVDTGIGFEQDQAERLFEKFEQAETTTSRRFGGTGLGLSICRMLARKMGGDVMATSTPGSGSVFKVTLPLRAVQKGASSQPAPQSDVVVSSTDFQSVGENPLRILLVEDNPINQQVAALALVDIDHHLTIADNGQIAVDKVEAEEFDIILMDVHMPVLDGLRATQLIREQEAEKGLPRTPIVMLSADGFDERMVASRQAGADDYLLKPIVPMDLIKKIRSLTGGGAEKIAV